MANVEMDDELSAFLRSGIYRFDNTNVIFLDPVRVLNRSYTRFRVSPAAYYSRFFNSSLSCSTENQNSGYTDSKKRKRSKKVKKKLHTLNDRERIADQRHQEVRPVLVKAHEALLGAGRLLEIVRNLRNDGCNGEKGGGDSNAQESELDFVELRGVWQAPFYGITLRVHSNDTAVENAVLKGSIGSFLSQGVESCDPRVPVFGSLVANEGSNDVEAELLNHKYIMPKKSGFFMSDISQIRNLIPAESDYGFNLIVIDPPWENSSARQKMKYQTLPNRYFLSLPIKQLTHTVGALVALWITNREKLRSFVENELFPKWGVKHAATFYWLKVKADGSLICELDVFHHRPYECLLLGFCLGEDMNAEHLLRLHDIPDNQVFISVPGDYSRKPPVGELLLDYVPWCKSARCIELFSRDMLSGWTSWGNEPLHFQDSRYFLSRVTDS